MKKVIFIFLFAIMFSLASFTQPATPTVVNDGPGCEEVVVFNCNVTDAYIYWWDYNINDGDFTSIQGTHELVVATSVDGNADFASFNFRVKIFVSGQGWSAYSNWSSSGNYIWPESPGTVSGEIHPVTEVPYPYAVTDVQGAVTYGWHIDNGSYSGSSSTNQISVTFHDEFNVYTIEVAGANAGCGEGYGSSQKRVETVF